MVSATTLDLTTSVPGAYDIMVVYCEVLSYAVECHISCSLLTCVQSCAYLLDPPIPPSMHFPTYPDAHLPAMQACHARLCKSTQRPQGMCNTK